MRFWSFLHKTTRCWENKEPGMQRCVLQKAPMKSFSKLNSTQMQGLLERDNWFWVLILYCYLERINLESNPFAPPPPLLHLLLWLISFISFTLNSPHRGSEVKSASQSWHSQTLSKNGGVCYCFCNWLPQSPKVTREPGRRWEDSL